MHDEYPLSLRDICITDPFWKREMDLVRGQVIPYQWKALNDRVPDAAPSWWMHNMRAAARAVRARKAGSYFPPQAQIGFRNGPPEGSAPSPDAFYGFVFQDSDGYKWIEAAAYQLMTCHDEELMRRAREAVDAVCAAQEEDGYLDTYYTLTGREKAFSNLKDHHELYCFGHLTEAAVAWHQATGRTDLLDAARRFGDCIARRFGPGKQRGCPGHELAEMALFRLYEETGEKCWLDLACFFLDVRGTEPSTFALEENAHRREQNLPELPVSAERYVYHQAHMPVRDLTEAAGHAVRQMYLCCGMADAARLTGDKAMEEACRRLWRSAVGEKMYVTGGVGATHEGEAFSRPYDLPSDTAYSETCAAVGLAFFARRMLRLERDSRYADAMERALYNTVLAGMALDGKSFFYVNPLQVDPEACRSDARLRHVKEQRQKWFGCACCPPNLARLVSSLPAYIAGQDGNTLYIHLYVGSLISAELNGSPLRLRLDADLARDGNVMLTVESGSAGGRLAFRVPEWAGEPAVLSPFPFTMEKGYLVFDGIWHAGDTVRIDFPMPVRIISASPRVRETAGQVCFARGPLVYCAEERDNGGDLHLLRVDPGLSGKAEVLYRSVNGLEVPCIQFPGSRITQRPGMPLYAPWKPAVSTRVSVVLVPYFVWGNRGQGEMRVWLYAAPEAGGV